MLVSPMLAEAGVLYDVTVRSVDQSDLALVVPGGPPANPAATQYWVEGGKVRVGRGAAKTVYVFKDRAMYVIDTTTRTVHVLKHATLSQLAAHYAEAVARLEKAAANAAPEDRAEAQRKAVDMREVSERMRRPVSRDFRITVRFESVDGRACRIWEERERGAKRLELCIAPTGTISGGADIVSGLKTMSQFREGSDFAFGVDFGLTEWWPDLASLGGIPLLIREFKYDSEISETLVSNIRDSAGIAPSDSAVSGSVVPGRASPFDPPDGYQLVEGPEYTHWYVR